MLSNGACFCTSILWQGLTATGLKRDQIFFGDINTLYKSGSATVDVKVDTYSNVRGEHSAVEPSFFFFGGKSH